MPFFLGYLYIAYIRNNAFFDMLTVFDFYQNGEFMYELAKVVNYRLL
jgi:hypothetical protein